MHIHELGEVGVDVVAEGSDGGEVTLRSERGHYYRFDVTPGNLDDLEGALATIRGSSEGSDDGE